MLWFLTSKERLAIQIYERLSFIYLEPWTALFSAAMLRRL